MEAVYRALQGIGQALSDKAGPIFLVPSSLTGADREDLLRRLRFYAPAQADEASFKFKLASADLCSRRPILVFGHQEFLSSLRGRLRTLVFDVDFRHNPVDGWAWCQYAGAVGCAQTEPGEAQRRLISYMDNLKALGLERCYIFGTGISLARALDKDWSDGYRVVCNTIVRDSELWKHINPHFIVAGDAIYHFGFTEFAVAFRRDLRRRLAETGAYFVYPSEFNEIALREFSDYADRLIPIPYGKHRRLRVDLAQDFELPFVGNVLNLLLIPLATTLSKAVYMWGFDGRAPDDKLFWSNSSQHSYPELMASLVSAHPAFFEHLVPSHDPEKYVKSVHGDELDESLTMAEREGYRFVMMHKSWTPTLQKRFIGREN